MVALMCVAEVQEEHSHHNNLIMLHLLVVDVSLKELPACGGSALVLLR